MVKGLAVGEFDGRTLVGIPGEKFGCPGERAVVEYQEVEGGTHFKVYRSSEGHVRPIAEWVVNGLYVNSPRAQRP